MAFVLLTAIFLFVYRMLPYSDEDIRSSIVDTEHRYNYVIKQGGSPLLYFKGITPDSAFIALSDSNIMATERSLGCWINSSVMIPSCRGRIATVFSRCDSSLLVKDFIVKVIKEEITTNENYIAALSHARLEMNYYLDTHGYKDDGYMDVVRYRDSLDVEKKKIKIITQKLKEAQKSKDLSVEYLEEYTARYQNISKKCNYLNTSDSEGCTLLQLCDSITPENVTSLNLWNVLPLKLREMKETVFVVGRSYHNSNDMMMREIEKIPENVSGDTLITRPRLNIMKGAPVFTRSGIFIGIIDGDTIIHRNIIRKSL